MLVGDSTPANENTAPTRQSRLTASEDLSRPSSVHGCLSAVCNATNSEDLDAFLNCFTVSTRTRLRKPAAVMFVQHDVSIELIDHAVVAQSGNRARAAVKYITTRSGDKYTVFAMVDMRKEHGYWRIAKENVQAVDHEPRASCTASRYSCFGGQCGLAR
jgi:hypothetical protein